MNVFLKLVVLAYGIYKLSYTLERKGVSIIQTEEENYYSYSDEFTANQGLFIAFGMDWAGPSMPPEVGTLEMISWAWYPNEDYTVMHVETKALEFHECTPEELGLVESDQRRLFGESRFSGWENAYYTANASTNCINASDTRIHGTYSSPAGRMLLVRLRMCTNRTDCLSELEIKDWLRNRQL